MIAQGDVWWAELGEPIGSAPGYRRPVVVVQSDRINDSRIGTVVVVPLSGNMNWARAPGNVRLTANATGLERDSVANASHIIAVDKILLSEHVGRISQRHLDQIFAGFDIILGR